MAAQTKEHQILNGQLTFKRRYADESCCSLLCTVPLVSILSQRKPREPLVSNPAFPATNTDAVNSAATCETVAEVSELSVDALKTHGAARGLCVNCAVQLDD